jgi:DNA-binding NarL/FixJ family response regulator
MSARAIPAVAQVGAATKVECHHPLAGSALLSETDWAEAARALRLSGRELQIVRGVFDNCKETAIATDLGIASRTVDTHMERLYRKLTVNTRVALVLRVMEEALQAKARPETGSGKVLAATTSPGTSAGSVG